MQKTKHRRQKYAMSSMQKALITLLALSYALFLATFTLLQTSWLSSILGYSFIGPIGFDLFPLILPPLGIAFFLFIERAQMQSQLSLAWPTLLGFFVRIALFISIIALTAWITHPTQVRWEIIDAFMNTYDPMAEPFIATGLYASLFLPLLPSLFLFVPTTFIRKYAVPFAGGFFLLLFYIFTHTLEAFYHVATASSLLRIVGGVLGLFPGITTVSPERWEVAYRGFSVVLGPLCSGFTAMALFTAIFCVLWWRLTELGSVYHTRAFLALLAGTILFFFINILRIVLIMIIGSFSHVLGMVLFHGTAGSLFFFLVIVLMIRFILPVLRRR